jgi:alanine racemase
METIYLKAWIDLPALEHNCELLRSHAGGRKVCVAIKANAYGHGVGIVLPVMQKCRIDMLGVACIEEAVELRDLGWAGPVLIFGSEFSVYSADQREQIARMLVEKEIRITVTRREDVEILSRAARHAGKPARIHLAMDSGMSRMGLLEEDICPLIGSIRDLPGVEIEGLYTHFATADCADKRFAREQLSRFNRFVARLAEEGIQIPIIHAANSGATIDLPEAHLTMVRPGISTYGYHAGDEMHQKPDLRPILKLTSRLTLVKQIPAGSFVGYGCTFQAKRPTLIGLVPIGYADGYFRELSNRGRMIVKDTFVPVIGRVSMDQTILDLTDVNDPNVGDDVVIYDNRRESPNSVESTARLLNTIPYVVTTSLGRRVKRIGVS